MPSVIIAYSFRDACSSEVISLILKSSSPFPITPNELSANISMFLDELSNSSNHSLIYFIIVFRFGKDMLAMDTLGHSGKNVFTSPEDSWPINLVSILITSLVFLSILERFSHMMESFFFVSKEGAARIKNRKKISGGGGQKIRAIGQGDFVR